MTTSEKGLTQKLIKDSENLDPSLIEWPKYKITEDQTPINNKKLPSDTIKRLLGTLTIVKQNIIDLKNEQKEFDNLLSNETSNDEQNHSNYLKNEIMMAENSRRLIEHFAIGHIRSEFDLWDIEANVGVASKGQVFYSNTPNYGLDRLLGI